MKKALLFICLTLTNISFGQKPKEKKEIIDVYQIGEGIKKVIRDKNFSKIDFEFKKIRNYSNLLSFLKGEKFNKKEYKLYSDIYFHPNFNNFVYTIYCSKYINEDSDWGLNDYLFVIEILIDYNQINKRVKFSNKRIIYKELNLKSWWKSLMRSYEDSKFLRNKWAKEFKLIPPPPPPPKHKEWLKR